MVTRKDVGDGIAKLLALLSEMAGKHPVFIEDAMKGRDISQALAYIGQQADKGNPVALEVLRLATDRGILDIGNWDGES